MKIQSSPTHNLRKLTQVGPQKSDRPVSDSFSNDPAPSWKPLHRQQMARALDVAEHGVAGAALGCLAGYGLEGGIYTSLGLAAFGLVAGAAAGTGLALGSNPQKPSPLPIALVSLAGLALGAAAGTDLLGPGLRLAAVAAMGAGAGISLALGDTTDGAS